MHDLERVHTLSQLGLVFLMVSSSAVVSKMLRDLHLEHERAGQQALGIAVLEDVVAIVMITLLGSYTNAKTAARRMPTR